MILWPFGKMAIRALYFRQKFAAPRTGCSAAKISRLHSRNISLKLQQQQQQQQQHQQQPQQQQLLFHALASKIFRILVFNFWKIRINCLFCWRESFAASFARLSFSSQYCKIEAALCDGSTAVVNKALLIYYRCWPRQSPFCKMRLCQFLSSSTSPGYSLIKKENFNRPKQPSFHLGKVQQSNVVFRYVWLGLIVPKASPLWQPIISQKHQIYRFCCS